VPVAAGRTTQPSCPTSSRRITAHQRGTPTLTPELLIKEFHDHYHADITTMFDHDSLAIMDFERSLKHDIPLLRSSAAVPKHIKLYGSFCEISAARWRSSCIGADQLVRAESTARS
jgi:hypothetical protein